MPIRVYGLRCTQIYLQLYCETHSCLYFCPLACIYIYIWLFGMDTERGPNRRCFCMESAPVGQERNAEYVGNKYCRWRNDLVVRWCSEAQQPQCSADGFSSCRCCDSCPDHGQPSYDVGNHEDGDGRIGPRGGQCPPWYGRHVHSGIGGRGDVGICFS